MTPPLTESEVLGVRLRNQAEDPRQPWTFEVEEPATGQIMARVVGGGVADATRAVDAAQSVSRDWGGQPRSVRADLLRRMAEAIEGLADGPTAELVTRETGKRLEEARAEIRFSARYFAWFADVISTSRSQLWEVVSGVKHLVRWRSLGVVALLTPWNFPVSIPARKIAPALAGGCAVVFRPSRFTPLSSLALAEAIEPFLPPGVLNTVAGDAQTISDVWLGDPRIKGVSFTGSTSVGRALAESAGRRLKVATLELGGRAPFIVLPDAVPEEAVEQLMGAKYRNNGASCIAANNVWVHRRLWDPFVEAYLERTAKMRLGDPLDEGVDLGPVRTAQHVERLSDLVEEARAGGSEAIHGDSVPSEGSYIPPTVILDPQVQTSVWQEEIFGPITPIRAFDDLEEVIEDSDASPYGLAGYICSQDSERALDLAARLEIGIVGVNVSTPNVPQIPFGGFKESGYGGYEGGRLGLEPFIKYQSIAVSTTGEEAGV